MSLRVEFYLIDNIEALRSSIQNGDKDLRDKVISFVESKFEPESVEEYKRMIKEVFAKKTTAINVNYDNLSWLLVTIAEVSPGFIDLAFHPIHHSFYWEMYELFKEINEKSHFTKVLEYTSSPRPLFTGEPEPGGWNYYSYILHSEAVSALLEMPTVLKKLAEDRDAKQFVNDILRSVLEQSVLLKKDIFIFAD